MKKLRQYVLLLILLCPMLSYAKPPPKKIQAIIERSSAAVVHISVQEPIYASRYPKHFAKFGSGIIVDAKKGIILTNAHVVESSKNIKVTLKDGRNRQAKLIGRDQITDIAVLQIHTGHLTALPLAHDQPLHIGDWVAAIGSPFGLNQTVTSGMISALHRHIGLEGVEDFIQTDASINPGNSGGALINQAGELIGINTAIVGPVGSKGGSVGIGLAIPIHIAKAIMDQFITYGDVKRGLLGVHIQDLTRELAAMLHHDRKEGVLVTHVLAHSSAMLAGIRAEDIILSINQQPVINTNQLMANVSVIRAGTPVPLTLLRAGNLKRFRLAIKPAYGNKQKALRAYDLLTGVNFRTIQQFNTERGTIHGIGILGLEPHSLAWLAGLRPGDIILSANRTTLSDLPHFLKIAQAASKLLLKIYRANHILYLVLSQ